MRAIPLVLVALFVACDSPPPATGTPGMDCAQDGSCPSGLVCFPDWRCYARDATPPCDPPCYGATPLCDRAALRCVACLTDGDCPAGSVCAPPNQRCVSGCAADHPSCAGDGEVCDVDAGVCHGCLADGDCTDPSSPRCDVASGVCVPCLPDGKDCPPGQYCGGAAGAWACTLGCATGADCGSSPTAACCQHRCVDTAGDGNNCGACGAPCYSGKTCCGGLCSDVTRDLENCGGCGVSCDLPNAVVACSAGKCAFTGCESYFADCDGNAQNGCEVNLTRDPNNCYACGHVCPAPPHASAGCSVDDCGIGACNAGWADCNHFAGDGCETDVASDPASCGACNHACPTGHACVNGACA